MNDSTKESLGRPTCGRPSPVFRQTHWGGLLSSAEPSSTPLRIWTNWTRRCATFASINYVLWRSKPAHSLPRRDLLQLLELKFQRNGLLLLDEPEAALSHNVNWLSCPAPRCIEKIQRRAIHHFNALAVLLGYPQAQIVSFDRPSARY